MELTRLEPYQKFVEYFQNKASKERLYHPNQAHWDYCNCWHMAPWDGWWKDCSWLTQHQSTTQNKSFSLWNQCHNVSTRWSYRL